MGLGEGDADGDLTPSFGKVEVRAFAAAACFSLGAVVFGLVGERWRGLAVSPLAW